MCLGEYWTAIKYRGYQQIYKWLLPEIPLIRIAQLAAAYSKKDNTAL